MLDYFLFKLLLKSLEPFRVQIEAIVNTPGILKDIVLLSAETKKPDVNKQWEILSGCIYQSDLDGAVQLSFKNVNDKVFWNQFCVAPATPVYNVLDFKGARLWLGTQDKIVFSTAANSYVCVRVFETIV